MSPTELDRIIERLEGIDPARPPFDKSAIEAALVDHFRAVGLPCPPIRWMVDLDAALRSTDGRGWHREWLIEEAAAWDAARVALGFGNDASWENGATPFRPVHRARAAEAASGPEDAAVAERAFSPRMTGSEGDRLLGPSWEIGTRGKALAGRLRSDGAAENRATRFEPWRPPPYQHLTGAGAVEEAVLWLWVAGERAPQAARRMVDIWSPLLAAFEAGLWVYFFFAEELLLVPRPAVRLHRERLHAEDGPAIAWPEGSQRWFWHGVEVPRHVVEDPASITTGEILKEMNVEVRRMMLERYGFRKFLKDLNASPVHSDDFGTLYRIQLPDDEPLVMVRVVNSTPEPDGTYKEYFLRVPPDVTTAHEAVAWTFGLPPEEYHPRQET